MSYSAHSLRRGSLAWWFTRLPAAVVLAGCLGAAIAGAVLVEGFLNYRRTAHHPPSPPVTTKPATYMPTEGWSVDKVSVGTQAADFCLPRLSDGQAVRLSDHRGHRPVVLVFSSFT